MTWRAANLSVTVATVAGPKWRVANLAIASGGTWRVSQLGVVVSTAPLATWRVPRIVVNRASWQVSNLGVVIAAPAVTTPVLAATTANLQVGPVAVVPIFAAPTNGVIPDSYSFVASAGSITWTNGFAAWHPPATPGGTTATVTITATKGASTSTPVVLTFTVRRAVSYWLSSDTTLHGQSDPYLA